MQTVVSYCSTAFATALLLLKKASERNQQGKNEKRVKSLFKSLSAQSESRGQMPRRRVRKIPSKFFYSKRAEGLNALKASKKIFKIFCLKRRIFKYFLTRFKLF